jgi:uncharacterized membrane protein
MWHIGDDMGWWMLAWTLVELLIVVGVIAAAVYWIRPGTDRRPEDPFEIAARRYASGEITRDEYEQVRRDLSDAGARTGSS